ncbi:MAG: xylose isomerase [Lentisphaerae bacterium]|nr:xylose isomerase [Lentisphaerota bacterium]MCP4099810.1 xylose isomerase [Lentisphaerota bacterium]
MAEYFPEVNKVKFEGRDSKNPLAFKFYDPDAVINGRKMKDHLRFAVAYWHTLKGTGGDMFGAGTWKRSWENAADPMQRAEDTLHAAFEFFTKLGVDYYCFHDRDIAPEGQKFSESCKNLDYIVKLAKKLQSDTGVKLLWGTANCFSNPRYAHGAGTNPDPKVFAYACAQIKHAMEATLELGGENYVFWGGREGYETLLNTNYALEQELFARFLQMAVDYKREIGFEGTLLIEPKPQEPTKHQYDFDSATVLGFLRQYGLLNEFKLNIEANHATLAGHTFQHELTVAAASGSLGSVDANTGDMLLGWDTDQFPTNIYDAVYAMMVIQQAGGFTTGGLNFDAKLRRGSVDDLDLFYGHIVAMDTFARGLIISEQIIKDGLLDEFVAKRYSGYNSGFGADIVAGKADFKAAEGFVLANEEPVPSSGRQEYLENLINSYI